MTLPNATNIINFQNYNDQIDVLSNDKHDCYEDSKPKEYKN